MASLGVHGDPDGWLNAGYAIKAALDQAEYDLGTADASGGSGLLPAWSGPVSEAYQEIWGRRRERYQDMIAHARRAVSALTDFGGRLADLQWRAASLERQWLGLGLHLTGDGLAFMLPWGHENLPHEARLSLSAWLDESERDIAAMWADIKAAVDDVVTVIESVIAALADFDMLELAAIGWVVSNTWDDLRKDPFPLFKDALDKFDGYTMGAALDAWFVAKDLEQTLSEDGDSAARLVVDAARADAKAMHDSANRLDGYTKIGDKALLGLAIVTTTVETGVSISKHGMADGIERNLGSWASLATSGVVGAGLDVAAGALIAAGAPEILVGVGAVAVGAVICAGVGHLVQSEADAHREAVDHALTDIGHGAADAANWEGKHAEDLLL